MIEDQFLQHFITEDIFIVEEQNYSNRKEISSPTQANEPDPEPISKPDSKEPNPVNKIYDLAIWTPPLTTKDRELLINILKAIKKDFSEALLMEGIVSYQPHFKTLLCFGYQKELELKTGKQMPIYQPVELENRVFLVSALPADLHVSKNEKSRLWTALQTIFSV